MSAGKPAEWLSSTAGAVRDLIVERLNAGTLDEDARRALEMALKEFDITWEQLKGQAVQLALEKERYAEFFEFAPEAYLITDAGGSVREANLAAMELLGLAREDVVGRALGELSVRPIELKLSGVQGLCWLLRPLDAIPG